jgi:asparagine synthase (glutamine-hydrolysing)
MAEAWHIQSRLATYAWQGARHGVAYAFPLLDLDLVEYSVRIPGIFLRSDGRRRVLYREALAGLLPDEVRLNPEKPEPFPGAELRIAADRDRLLELCRQWRNNARIGDFLDLDFMAHRIRTAADPTAAEDLSGVSLAFAFDVAHLLLALGEPPGDRGPR